MKSIVLAVALLIIGATSLRAQTPSFTTGPRFGVSVYGGYMQLDNLFRPKNGATYHNDNAGQVGVQAGVGLNSIIAFIGNLAYARASSQFALPGVQAVSASPNVGIWLLDGNLQLSLPWGYAVTPFVQVGVGAARYRMKLNGSTHGHTNVAFNAAIGADVPIGGTVGLVAMAKDYIVGFSWANVGDPRFDDHLTGNTTTNIGVSLGIEIGY